MLASPIAVLILVATLRGIDERLEDAAASMGAGRLTIALSGAEPAHQGHQVLIRPPLQRWRSLPCSRPTAESSAGSW
ncbi:hypothetical protein HDA41_000211 [Streptomyces caelestis]|uniref:Uncharacterized protein n=1 Tax=Streptomyces caelestis TaxID=36816 RepID=A0A7W9GYB0_9ACTN|nr:hypothetical protein [Streptomyces caelestis]